MALSIGIREEDKNVWERRAPLTPHAVAELRRHGIEIFVQRFRRRVFIDEEYAAVGARLVDDVSSCDVVLGIKEMPLRCFRPGGAYMFFSHTIKGQHHNMPMLARLVELGCTLFDYELVRDAQDRRLIFFGRYAGLAGMVDTLWMLGQRLLWLGHGNPFERIEPAHMYPSLQAIHDALAAAGARIETEGVPAQLAPFVFGFTGYGNVSCGAQEMFDLLPHEEVAPRDLAGFLARGAVSKTRLVKVVYHEEDLVAPAEAGRPFQLQEYYDHPERYRSIFEPHLRALTVLVNGIYWAEKYPRLASREQLRTLFGGPGRPRLLAVGDISCDVDGSVACTVRDTDSGDPVYVYDPLTGAAPSGVAGPGLAVLAVSNLPCEVPMEASAAFSAALSPFIPALVHADLGQPLERAGLPPELARSVILWHGEFTADYRYMKEFLR
jgi:alanine dehydrogenase